MLWIVLVCVVAVLVGAVALRLSCKRRPFSLKGRHLVVGPRTALQCTVLSMSLTSRDQVTGGSSGIGKAVALEAVRRGASVTLLARNEARGR